MKPVGTWPTRPVWPDSGYFTAFERVRTVRAELAPWSRESAVRDLGEVLGAYPRHSDVLPPVNVKLDQRIRAVVFDVGEVLIDETREYSAWADWLGVPRHSFSAVFGGIVASGRDHRETFQYFRPGFDLSVERRLRDEAGCPETFGPEDVYPDVYPCRSRLQANGYKIGIAGNQTARAESILRELALPADWIGTSASWGVEKPSSAFFSHIIARCQCAPSEIAYAGDCLDNDVGPALDAGMVAVFLRRGPWGQLFSSDPAAMSVCSPASRQS